MHHVSGSMSAATSSDPGLAPAELSTIRTGIAATLVDKDPGKLALGILVPKRHARRAVTRNLIRRQVRAVFARHAARLPGGSWLVRLRAPFARSEFVSAASTALARALRDELERLVARACRNGTPRPTAEAA
jgi:ribonuclease P protein component